MQVKERIRLAASSSRELEALLAPVSPQEFVREYWAKKPLYVKGFKEKYQGFFDGAAFSAALSAPGPVPSDFLRASFDRKSADGTSATPSAPREALSTAFRAAPDQAVALFDAGATLCVAQIETRVPSLQQFVAAIKRQLSYPGKVSFNAYLSPPGSGFNWHFDGRIATTLQIEGTKRWRYSNEPTMPWPRANGSIRADGVPQYADATVKALPWERLAPLNPGDVAEVVLEPGDLLVLPAGTWHEACGGTGGSLALNLSFTPLSFTTLIAKLLDDQLVTDAQWRGPAPVLDAEGLEAIGAALAKAGALLQSLRPDSAAVVRMWQQFVQSANPVLPLAAKAPVPIAATQRFRVRDDVHAMAAENATLLCLAFGPTGSMELSGAALPFVRRMLAEREFAAGECTAWNESGAPFAWSDVQAMLADLRGGGLIEEA